MTTNKQLSPVLSPVETALLELRKSLEQRQLAQFKLEDKVKQLCAEELSATQAFDSLIETNKALLIKAIGENGALPASSKSDIGWASYSSAERKQYAPLHTWRGALQKAQLEHLFDAIKAEVINEEVVDRLTATDGAFHKATESLVTVKLSKAALRYGFTQEKSTIEKKDATAS